MLTACFHLFLAGFGTNDSWASFGDQPATTSQAPSKIYFLLGEIDSSVSDDHTMTVSMERIKTFSSPLINGCFVERIDLDYFGDNECL